MQLGVVSSNNKTVNSSGKQKRKKGGKEGKKTIISIK